MLQKTDPATAEAGAPARKTNALRPVLFFGVPALVIVAALGFYLTGGRYAATDDAYVEAARAEISTNIPGRVTEVLVKDNQAVRKGQLLLRLDPQRYEIAVRDAEAALDVARRKIPSLAADYHQHQAEVSAAQFALAYRQREYERQKGLAAEGISSRAQLDEAQSQMDAARLQLAAAGQVASGTLAELGGGHDGSVDSQPAVRQAQAALDRAKLELSYTEVRAPIDGVAAKVEQIQPGDYINAAQPLFGVVSQASVWIEANFKETDVTHMRAGQAAIIKVDAFPGRTLSGHVDSASPGTGSSFALLPAENASGNWVKVVQRLPVRVDIDPARDRPALAAGMSVKVKVDTNHHRSLPFLGG
jgi:membrane fusion protein (multidrug efflux system)